MFIGPRVLLQHLLGEPAELAGAATTLLASGNQLFLTDVAFADVMTTLEGLEDDVPRSTIADLGRAVLGHPTIATVDDTLLLRALEQYEVDGRSFLDAYTVATAERTGISSVALDGGQVLEVASLVG